MIVFIEGKQETIIEPSKATLKKYGLTLNEWKDIIAAQEYRCPICLNPLTKRTNIDHSHARNWKKMTDDHRKRYVRGVLCFFCNKYYLGKAINISKAKRVVDYLEKFEKRLNEI